MIPYLNQYVDYLLDTGMEQNSIDYYTKSLFRLLSRARDLNVLFAKTNDPRKITEEDWAIIFEEIQYMYAPGTFNKFHTIVNSYYKFLLVELRLNVPPLSWTIDKKKLDKLIKYPEYDWQELTEKVILDDSFDDSEKAIFLFISKGLTRTQILAGTRDLGDYIPYSNIERNFIHDLKEKLSDVPVYITEGVMVVSKREKKKPQRAAINKMLAGVLKTLGITEKSGTLTSDARIYNALINDWGAREIEDNYNLVANLETNREVLKEVAKRKNSKKHLL
ncbi:hypothetical protein [Pseudolactococcus insecticola]|uniref:Core-binding (CB) domain-containing protein n=1 Tax=Pseudolactococcus insecticola TaxID=2709158 RepID=A0A6A0B7J5_9LACT|nr:hypothetical protein [Lactococcus insecticola]GFH41252.1 hypothetical protein Hs20B_16500 [Lactococcus insecticola]